MSTSRVNVENRSGIKWLADLQRETKLELGVMRAARDYLRRIQEMLAQLEETQLTAIETAGAICAEALLSGHQIYVSPEGSHAVHTELTDRAGGFINPRILNKRTTELRRGDIVIIATNAGFDDTTVGLALRCRAIEARTIAITSVAFERSIRSADPSGKMLHEVVDVCVDQGGPAGDALLSFTALDVPILPGSGVLSVTAAWMIFGVAAERMIDADRPPAVYQAVQLPGAARRNERQQAEARRPTS